MIRQALRFGLLLDRVTRSIRRRPLFWVGLVVVVLLVLPQVKGLM